MIVKRFKRPNIINQIVYSFFRRSKARRSFDYSLEVQKRGFGVADPIAYIEIKHGGLLTDSYYISLYMERMEELREYMAVYRAEDRELRLAFARFTAQLHKAEILHVDYSPGNILVKKQAGSYVFALVDVNRMKFKSISVVDACKNLARLATSRKVLDEVACEYASQRGWDSLEIMRLMGEYSDRFFKNYAFRLGNKAWRRNGGSLFCPSFVLMKRSSAGFEIYPNSTRILGMLVLRSTRKPACRTPLLLRLAEAKHFCTSEARLMLCSICLFCINSKIIYDSEEVGSKPSYFCR